MFESVPFFHVRDMAASLRFYEQLGFRVVLRWEPDGQLRWCRLEHGRAALMLQTFHRPPETRVGVGVSVSFVAKDALALHDAALGRGLAPAQEPFVGNGLWVVPYVDPDGYRLEVASATEIDEDTTLTEHRGGGRKDPTR
ncbi:MAG: VOC family protein [Planctomycetota bacterium]